MHALKQALLCLVSLYRSTNHLRSIRCADSLSLPFIFDHRPSQPSISTSASPPPSLALSPQRKTHHLSLSLSSHPPSLSGFSYTGVTALLHGTQQQQEPAPTGGREQQQPRWRRRSHEQKSEAGRQGSGQGRAGERQLPVPRREAAELGQMGGGDPGAAEAVAQVARHLRHRRGRRPRLRPRRAPPLRPPRAPQPHRPAAAARRFLRAPALAAAAPPYPAAAGGELAPRLGLPPPPAAAGPVPPAPCAAADALLRQHGHCVRGDHHHGAAASSATGCEARTGLRNIINGPGHRVGGGGGAGVDAAGRVSRCGGVGL
jgi:hypothetical protein